MRQVLVAEFVVCILILGLSPLSTDEAASASNAGRWMRKGTAMCGVFLVLGLASSAGPGAAKVAASFGGIVTLALAIDQRSMFGRITEILK